MPVFLKVRKILQIIFWVFIVINLLVLDYLLILQLKKNSLETKNDSNKDLLVEKTESNVVTPVNTEDCPGECNNQIEERVSREIEKLKTTLVAGQSGTSPFPKLLPTQTPEMFISPKIIYIPILSEGGTILTGWTNIVPSEFYFDLNNYPGAKSVKFEAYLMAVHGSALVYGRLYDNSNMRGVDNSEISTQSDGFVLLQSSGVTIWRGNNKYTVQLRSANGTEVQLKEARLKIYY